MFFLVIVTEGESGSETVFGTIYLGTGTTLSCYSDLPIKIYLSFSQIFNLVLDCVTFEGVTKLAYLLFV